MNMPGFDAEAALATSSGRYGMACDRGLSRSEQVIPAAIRSSWTTCGHDPNDICIYRCCTSTIYDGPPYFTTTCTRDWVCAHRRPTLGSFLGM